MELALDRIYDSLLPVMTGAAGPLIYSVAPVPLYSGYFVGRDSNDRACILIAVDDRDDRPNAPIRLESLEVQFDVHSRIKAASHISDGTFTIIRCRAIDPEVIRYFFSIAETILRILGVRPTAAAVTYAVNRLARIFQRLQSPSVRSLNGLFGELYIIWQAHSPTDALAGWRVQDTSRFDFTAGNLRLDVKTAGGRVRQHTFAYDQCNPPSGTIAVVASLFVERAAGGLSLREFVRDIELHVRDNVELAVKLHEIVAETLGNTLQEGLAVRFDERLAASSLRFYDLTSIPAIRTEPPAGVSDIHFRSDLSAQPNQPLDALVDREPAISAFLPNVLARG